MKKQIRIFIVEDNKIFSMALKADIESAFSTMPIKVSIFETGEKCMEKLKEEMPQIVILDYHLNGRTAEAVDGIKVLDMVKKVSREINVIMLTRDDNIDIALKSFKHGASDYIVKTDTQFRKMIYTLFNLFRIMEARKNAIKYKYMVVGLCLFIALLIGGVVSIQIFNPLLFLK